MLGFDFFPASGNVRYFAKDVVCKDGFPRINIYKNDGEYRAVALMPGVEKQSVEVYSKHGYLVIKGNKKNHDNGKTGFVKSERGFGSFSRTIKGTRKIDPETVKAKLENGMLNIVFNLEPLYEKDVKVN